MKIIGRDQEDFEAVVARILRKHVEDLSEVDFQSRGSRTGKYLSLTVEFEAQSQDQLDALYRELSAHPKVLWAL